MQALFQLDLRGKGSADELGTSIADECRMHLYAGEELNADGLPNTPDRALNTVEKEVVEFAVHLVEGTLEHSQEIDKQLQAVTRNWDLRRMAFVARNGLGLAAAFRPFSAKFPRKIEGRSKKKAFNFQGLYLKKTTTSALVALSVTSS